MEGEERTDEERIEKRETKGGNEPTGFIFLYIDAWIGSG